MRNRLAVFCAVLEAVSFLMQAGVVNAADVKSGHGVQVVDVTDDHRYILNEKGLELVLMREDVRDLPVVVVSVAGAYRGGKSFLLNFFLRYWSSAPSTRDDGSWLGDDSEPLKGFTWSGGSKRNTTGILMWSEPAITILPSGEKVAVLLMDTQGTFDSSSTVRDCSTIFALSTLISSVQIYNIAQNIQEDDLQHLQLFTEYGKLVQDQDSKAFQVLQFLVRDWQFPWEFQYGSVGGNQLLEERLRINPKLSGELQDLRRHIRSSFSKVSCYLMPHPGFAVLDPNYKGEIKVLLPEFRKHLNLLVHSIFSPAQLVTKLINNEKIKGRQLFTYFKLYMGIFNSDELPSPTSILKATAEAGLLTAYEDALHLYVNNMISECGEKQLCVPAEDVKILHERYKTQALNSFSNKKKMGSANDANQKKIKLTEEVDARGKEFALINMAKQQKAMESAKEAYDGEIAKISNGKLFCVHPVDVAKVHSKALDTSMRIFDAARKRYSNKPDEERNKFKQGLEKKLASLKVDNDRNNELFINEGRMEYWEYMEQKCSQEPPLTATKLQNEHMLGLEKVKESFQKKRNLKNSYTEDVFLSQLNDAIAKRFNEIKEINTKQNRRAILAAIDVYNSHINSAWNHRDQCLHPEDLKNEHNAAVCKAMKKLRPQRTCSSDYRPTDEDETALLNVLKSRYTELDKSNDGANNNAIIHAMKVYAEKVEERERPNWWWLTVIPAIVNVAQRASLKFHREAKEEAINAFYSMRRSKGNEGTDPYRHRLETLLSDSSEWNRFWRSLGASS